MRNAPMPRWAVGSKRHPTEREPALPLESRAMGDLQHFCLRWNNYQSSITSAFENLRDDEDFVDVTLACDGKSLKAHRVVLSACSPYFRELLKSTPCKHPVIVLQDVIFEDLHALVEFIYHGEVNVHQKALPSFLKTAEVLRVSGLTQQSEAKEEAGEKGREVPEENWLAYRRTPTSSQPQYRHRERRPSNSENTDTQESNSVPPKKIRTESSSAHNEPNQQPQNNHQQDKDESEPPVDFSKLRKQEGESSSPGPGRERDREREGREEIHPHPPVKSEPVEAGGGGEPDDSNESAVISEPQIVTTEHDDSIPSGPHQNYFDSKLFAVAGASFNFSMAAALAADSLAGLNNQGHVATGNELVPAGTSQGSRGHTVANIHCHICGRGLASNATLHRHIQDIHCSQTRQFWCFRCHKPYRTRNSLLVHNSKYHPKNKDWKL